MSRLRQFAASIPLPVGPLWYLTAFRWLLVVGIIAAVFVTWPLWQVRTGPAREFNADLPPVLAKADVSKMAPMMPVFDGLPQINMGWPMIASALLLLVRPWWGAVAHTIVVIVAMLLDQTRIQHYHQTMFLVWGTLPSLNCQMVARANLIAMWFWAGTHKLFSPGFNFQNETAYQVLTTIFPPTDFPADGFPWITPTLGVIVGWGIAISELSLALLSLVPRTRKFAACYAFVVHVGILCTLKWISRGWYSNVGPWNVELALAGFVLIAPWKEAPWISWLACRRAVQVLVIFLLVYPVGFYANVVDAYLSHCIYVKNMPEGVILRTGPDPHDTTRTIEQLQSIQDRGAPIVNVPLPPSHHLFEEFFAKVRQPGDLLVIKDPRPWAARAGMSVRILSDDGEVRGTRITADRKLLDGKKHGFCILRDESGNKIAEGNFVRGQKHGPWVYYYPNGQREMAGTYDHDQEVGTWTTWSADGKLIDTIDGALLHAEGEGGGEPRKTQNNTKNFDKVD